MNALNEYTFGSDLFWNGTLDDSAFDLLFDINNVGKLLFDNFKDSPEVLFFRLPQASTSSTVLGSDISSLNDQFATQLGSTLSYVPLSGDSSSTSS